MAEVDDADAKPAVDFGAGVAIDGRARVRRIALRSLAISAAVLVLLPIGSIALPSVSYLSVALILLTGLATPVAGVSFIGFVVNALRGAPPLRPRRVTVSGGALRLATPGSRSEGSKSEQAFPISDVVQGFLEEPDLVRLTLKTWKVVVIQTALPEHRVAILRAASVTAAERVVRFELASAASMVPGGSVFAVVLAMLLGMLLLPALIGLAFAVRSFGHAFHEVGLFAIATTVAALVGVALYAISASLRKREVVVGTDGVAFRKSFRTQFIPYPSVGSLVADTRGVKIVHKGGPPVLLPTRRVGRRPLSLSPKAVATPAEVERRALLERIGEAMAAAGGNTAQVAHVALDRLDRAGRDVATWRAALGDVLSGEGDYRVARITAEDLGGVIEDASAPVERRVAATVALASRQAPEAKRRVRIAVQACADEALQRALESAAEGEIDDALLDRANRTAMR